MKEEKGTEEILKERGETYGEYTRVANTTKLIKDAVDGGKHYLDLSCAQELSLYMIANKIARIVNGEVNYIDSWRDIAGYATLVVKELEKIEAENASF